MAISVDCTGCGRHYTVKDEAAGRKFKCKDCGAVVDVPAGAFEAADPDDEFAGLNEDLEAGDVAQSSLSPPPRRRRTTASHGRGNAAERVKAPAICLIVTAGFSIGVRILVLGLSAFGIAMLPQAGAQPDNMAQFVGGIIGNVIGLAFNVATLLGAIKMLKLESLSSSRAAAIIAVIPCCSPCVILGIPFGIWALVVLNDPDVRESFTS